MKHWYYKEECDADLSVCQHNPRLHTWCPSLCAWVLCSHRGYLRCNCVHAYLLYFSTPFWNVSVTARYERYWIASKYQTAQEYKVSIFFVFRHRHRAQIFWLNNWKRICTDTRDKCRISYPVHNWSPSFHCYALEDGYHSYCNVIKSRDSVVRTDPVSTAVEAFITFSPAKYFSNSFKWSLITWSGIIFH